MDDWKQSETIYETAACECGCSYDIDHTVVITHLDKDGNVLRTEVQNYQRREDFFPCKLVN